MKYLQLKSELNSRIDSSLMFFAFNKEQFERGLEKLECTVNDLVNIGGGGFVRKDEFECFSSTLESIESEMEAALEDDDFMLDAIIYELANHEFCITRDPEPTLSALGLSLESQRVKDIFAKARAKYLETAYD